MEPGSAHVVVSVEPALSACSCVSAQRARKLSPLADITTNQPIRAVHKPVPVWANCQIPKATMAQPNKRPSLAAEIVA